MAALLGRVVAALVLLRTPLFVAATDAAGTKLLAAKAAEESVMKLPSGLLYKVL